MRVEHVQQHDLDAVAGYPTHCPHGDPIPTRDGRIAEVRDQPLVEAPVGAAAVLRRVKTDDGDKLRYLAQLGLVPGVALEVLGRGPFNGPFMVRVRDREHPLGEEVCSRIWVTPPDRVRVEEPEPEEVAA